MKCLSQPPADIDEVAKQIDIHDSSLRVEKLHGDVGVSSYRRGSSHEVLVQFCRSIPIEMRPGFGSADGHTAARLLKKVPRAARPRDPIGARSSTSVPGFHLRVEVQLRDRRSIVDGDRSCKASSRGC